MNQTATDPTIDDYEVPLTAEEAADIAEVHKSAARKPGDLVAAQAYFSTMSAILAAHDCDPYGAVVTITADGSLKLRARRLW